MTKETETEGPEGCHDDYAGSDASSPEGVDRRQFIQTGLAVTGSIIACQTGASADQALAGVSGQPDSTHMTLQQNIKGQVLTPSDPAFEKAALNVWNKYGTGNRRPQVIVRVRDEHEVVEAVKYAKANKLKVAVRGGGHNWCNPSLRNGGMLIDLENLNQVISVDAKAYKAVVQPFVSNREVQARLNAQNLAFPSGHCPPVKVSGYLLSGGMSWNQGVWGPGVGSVEAVELVAPSGKMITADKDQNTDYYWAARGAGPGFFGVVTRYHLKLYDLPKAIASSTYYYPIGEVETVARWLESIAGHLPQNIELSLFMLTAPHDLAESTKADSGKVCMVTATIFADSMEEARSSLKPLDECPIIEKCLSKEVAKPCTFENLFDASGSLWPADHRSQVEATFSNSKLADLFHPLRQHFLTAPSRTSLIMFAIFTGPNVPAPLPDAAFSMSARYYGGPWTMWKEEKDDAANAQWHARCLELLKPFVAGYYIGESDTVTYPHMVRDSYSEAKWKRLQELRKRYDPEGVFFDYSQGLS